jgi:adenosylmethionine-8-amino-7-oxononanoate aminotransferase
MDPRGTAPRERRLEHKATHGEHIDAVSVGDFQPYSQLLTGLLRGRQHLLVPRDRDACEHERTERKGARSEQRTLEEDTCKDGSKDDLELNDDDRERRWQAR